MSHHQPDPNIKVNLTIDEIPVTVPEGTRILEAAKKANVNIPTLCEHPDLCKRALCRICVVEADGRGKLIAACANDVWEGVSIVTNNRRLLNIRKTIVELILANHPQDCLSCVRSTNCELQPLAKYFAAGDSLFPVDAEKRPSKTESGTLVRDMNKCVKCSRCVEACQEVQTIRAINTSHRSNEYEISTPYGQNLKDSGCVFCGQCAKVCPVGAIYEYDQTAEVRDALASGRKAISQISPEFAAAVNGELDLAEGTVTSGKIAAAVKMLGFDKVYDAGITASLVDAEICGEVLARKSGAEKLPVISGCSEGAVSFVKNFYPDLTDHLTAVKNPRQILASQIKNSYAKNAGTEPLNVTSVSFAPCLAKKYCADCSDKTDFALTAKELVRMLKLAGIVIETLTEEPFDSAGIDLPKQDNPVKKETVHGFAEARKVMESILKGECGAQWVEILNCPEDNCRRK